MKTEYILIFKKVNTDEYEVFEQHCGTDNRESLTEPKSLDLITFDEIKRYTDRFREDIKQFGGVLSIVSKIHMV